jgi:hypothetical protein
VVSITRMIQGMSQTQCVLVGTAHGAVSALVRVTLLLGFTANRIGHSTSDKSCLRLFPQTSRRNTLSSSPTIPFATLIYRFSRSKVVLDSQRPCLRNLLQIPISQSHHWMNLFPSPFAWKTRKRLLWFISFIWNEQ